MKAQKMQRRRFVGAIDVRPFRFERRAEGRAAAEGAVMAAFFDEDGALSLTRVELVDESAAGMGLRCPVEVPVGARFSLHARDGEQGHTTGMVARCDRRGEEWSIGLRCDRMRAA